MSEINLDDDDDDEDSQIQYSTVWNLSQTPYASNILCRICNNDSYNQSTIFSPYFSYAVSSLIITTNDVWYDWYILNTIIFTYLFNLIRMIKIIWLTMGLGSNVKFIYCRALYS